MYARYNPARRKDTLPAPKPADDQAKKTSDLKHNTHASIQRDASSTYSRYIPTLKPRSLPPKQAHGLVVSSKRPEIRSPSKRKWEDLNETSAITSKKSRKDKTQKDFAKAPQEEGIITGYPDTPPAKPIESQQTPAPEVQKTNKKEEKKKKRSKDGEKPGLGNEEGDVQDSRHKKLLEKREKSIKKAEKLARKEAKRALKDQSVVVNVHAPPIEEVHDLVPLPQQDPIPEPPPQSNLQSLPSWLAKPIRVSLAATSGFEELGILPDVAKNLRTRGFNDAFAIQSAVLPLLLPNTQAETGDVVVSAATGSGKTLAYMLPMIENISHNIITRLRGLIVMPTRELVAQARDVCELCASAFAVSSRKRVKVGTAVGNVTFKDEQSILIDQVLRYNPEEYRELQRRLNSRWESSDIGSDGEDDVLCREETVPSIPDHVTDHEPKVDILICTPGRLVEHLKSTPGFSLDYIKWLVVDEADKLLDQSYQQWLDVVIAKVHARTDSLPRSRRDRVRKVILSATMTTDVGQLSSLTLYRPKLVVLEGSPQIGGDAAEEHHDFHPHVLPPLLDESAIKVDDESIKPLYLLELLSREQLIPENYVRGSREDKESDHKSSDESSSENDSSSNAESVFSEQSIQGQTSNSKTNGQKRLVLSKSPRGVLIFTKSNETAVRLGRLLSLLSPSTTDILSTLTSTTRSSARNAAINAFESGKLSVLVASDLVSRGLDLSNLAHVVNYDIPTSVTNYIHRVGRTARAGKNGKSWTLFTPSEGRWFWNEIARSQLIERQGGKKVARVTISAEIIGEEDRRKYEWALETLSKEASGSLDKKASKGR